MLARAALSVLLLLPLGCALSTEPHAGREPQLRLAPGDEVVFRAEQTRYTRGDTANIVLQNGTDQPIGYNLCSSARELRTGDSWRRYVPLRVCTAALYVLDPGGEVVLREPITAEWEPGEYRMVTTVELLDASTGGEVFTPSFTVAR